MLSLSNLIKTSLGRSDIPPWLPELTDKLVAVGWERLNRETVLTLETYGTARASSGNASAELVVVRDVPTGHDPGGLKKFIRVEAPTADLVHLYEGVGVKFYTAEELSSPTVLNCLEEATQAIRYVPSLWGTASALVRSLHVIIPTDDEHDISFSEPHIPFSVFVSIPRRRIRNDVLRVAEAIVHESMHLQLTLIEKTVPLLTCTQRKYFSPWREEYRSAQGILHALYVFRVVDRLLRELLSSPHLRREELGYARKRRTQIAAQMREVESFCKCPDLTVHGSSLVSRLLI
jgi:hypothetical protein